MKLKINIIIMAFFLFKCSLNQKNHKMLPKSGNPNNEDINLFTLIEQKEGKLLQQHLDNTNIDITNIRDKNSYNQTLLHKAALIGDMVILENLIKKIKNRLKFNNDIDIYQLNVNLSNQLSIIDDRGFTPLDVASNLEISNLLLLNGALSGIIGSNQSTFGQSQDSEIIHEEKFINDDEKNHTNQITKEQKNSLFNYVRLCQKDELMVLIKKLPSTDISMIKENMVTNNTLFHISAQLGYIDILTELINYLHDYLLEVENYDSSIIMQEISKRMNKKNTNNKYPIDLTRNPDVVVLLSIYNSDLNYNEDNTNYDNDIQIEEKQSQILSNIDTLKDGISIQGICPNETGKTKFGNCPMGQKMVWGHIGYKSIDESNDIVFKKERDHCRCPECNRKLCYNKFSFLIGLKNCRFNIEKEKELDIESKNENIIEKDIFIDDKGLIIDVLKNSYYKGMIYPLNEALETIKQ